MKRLSADDSADSRVKVGHRQATYSEQSPCDAGALASLGCDRRQPGGKPGCQLASPVRLQCFGVDFAGLGDRVKEGGEAVQKKLHWCLTR